MAIGIVTGDLGSGIFTVFNYDDAVMVYRSIIIKCTQLTSCYLAKAPALTLNPPSAKADGNDLNHSLLQSLPLALANVHKIVHYGFSRIAKTV